MRKYNFRQILEKVIADRAYYAGLNYDIAYKIINRIETDEQLIMVKSNGRTITAYEVDYESSDWADETSSHEWD